MQDTHLGPLEAGQAEAAAGDVVAHGAVVAVALAPAVQVVGAGGAGVGAHLALDNRCSLNTVEALTRNLQGASDKMAHCHKDKYLRNLKVI